MIILPESTVLGKLRFIQVYEYYDRPVLFSCQNDSGTAFLAVLVEEEEDFEMWFYVPLSDRRFQHLQLGEIDLHDSFAQPEDGILFEVKIPYNGKPTSVRPIPSDEVSEDQLPLPGEFLESDREPQDRKTAFYPKT